MTRTLLEIDTVFTKHYIQMLEVQKAVKGQLDMHKYDLSKTEITEAIIRRMYAFWDFHVANNKGLLDRHTNTEASDFFTETGGANQSLSSPDLVWCASVLEFYQTGRSAMG